jgi:hypothetical protein
MKMSLESETSTSERQIPSKLPQFLAKRVRDFFSHDFAQNSSEHWRNDMAGRQGFEPR